MTTAIQIASDTAANWAAVNPVLGLGEFALETDTRKKKLGDGVTAWNALAYDSSSASVPPNTYVRVSEGPLSFTDTRVGGVADSSMSSAIDNAAALNAAYSMLSSSGGELFVPKGTYPFQTAPNAQPAGVWLTGEGYDYSTSTTTRPSRGSVFRALSAMTYLIRLGSGVGLAPGQTAASMRGMSLDGNNLATSTLWANGSRNRIEDTQVYSGVNQAFLLAGQNVHADSCIFAQDDTGDVITVAGTNVLDNKIWKSQIRSPGTTGAAVRINGGNATDIQMCHLWAGGGGVAHAAESLITVQSAGAGVFNTLITDNTIEGVYGPEIMLDDTAGGGVIATAIHGNKFYMNAGTPDVTYPVVYIKGGAISTLSFTGGSISATDSTHRYKSLFDIAAATSSTNGFVVSGVAARLVAALTTGITPPSPIEYSAVQLHDGASWKRTNNRGAATFAGDGTTTAFQIPHGCIATPSVAVVAAGSPAASAASYTVWDGTNITVTFTAAPASGQSVKLNWSADV